MSRVFRMVFISILENEPDQIQKTAEKLGEELGFDVEYFGIYA